MTSTSAPMAWSAAIVGAKPRRPIARSSGAGPKIPWHSRRLGAELITMTRWREALEVAERLARTPDGEVDGLAMIGAIQHHDDKAMAAAAYKRVLEIDPGLRRLPRTAEFRRVFWTQLTDELLAIGQPAEARRLLEQAPPEDRGPTFSWLLGRAYLSGRKFRAGRSPLARGGTERSES